MVREEQTPQLELDRFVRIVVGRGRELHWLIGAGTSLPAGIPTATDLIYDFKAILFAQAYRIPRRSLDFRNPDIRRRLDDYFVARHPALPAPGDPDEYAAFFETAYPEAPDRVRRIQRMIDDAEWRPVHAHVVLAGLWKLGLLHTVWTPNFDPVMEQAAVEVSGKAGWLNVSDLDSPSRAVAGLADPTRPLLVKIHGDFRSERLANTTAELRDADNELRRALGEEMRTHGLVVVGFSGRDDSVLDALEGALQADHAYRSGLYWVTLPNHRLYPRVQRLLAAARETGVDARVVECGGFEELMKAVELLLEPDDALAAVFERFQPRQRRSPFERLPRGGSWPKLRLNALAVADYPRSARLVVGKDLGGTREARAAVNQAGVDAVVARRPSGVAAFGSDADLLTAFADHDPSLDWIEIDPFGSHQDSSEMGLLYEALAKAISRTAGLDLNRRRREFVLGVPNAKGGTSAFDTLRKAVGGRVEGIIPGVGGYWAEAIRLRLEHRYGALWLVYEPTVWREGSKEAATVDQRREWTRERQARRYNRQYTALLKAWSDVVCSGQRELTTTMFGLTGGADASFVVKRLAPYVERLSR
ncbi:MAG: SIR2 family protein [Actinomycetota bacterium]|nr:SIR2 family protein [Actinomycetota bacterium]